MVMKSLKRLYEERKISIETLIIMKNNKISRKERK